MSKTILELTKFKLVITEDAEGVVDVVVTLDDKEIDTMTFDANEFAQVEGGTQEEPTTADEETSKVEETPQVQIESFSEFLAKKEKLNESSK